MIAVSEISHTTKRAITGWLLAASFLVLILVSFAIIAEDKGITIIEGTLTDRNGAPASGDLALYAWPSERHVLDMVSGTEIPTVEIDAMRVARTGVFNLEFPENAGSEILNLIEDAALDLEITAFLDSGEIATTFLQLQFDSDGRPVAIRTSEQRDNLLPASLEIGVLGN